MQNEESFSEYDENCDGICKGCCGSDGKRGYACYMKNICEYFKKMKREKKTFRDIVKEENKKIGGKL